MTRNLPQISDEEARRLWQRAAELQETAERDAASRALSPPDPSRLSLEHVSQAAEGAGISADFVLLAMAEMQLPDADGIRRDRRSSRWLRALVSETDSIEAAGVVDAAPDAAIDAMKAVARQPAFNLLLENTVGTSDELRDRVLVFRLQGGASQFSGALDLADVRVLLVTTRPMDGGTHVRIRAPLFRRRINLSIASGATTLGGVGGSWAGWSAAGWAAGLLGVGAGAALLVPAGLAALAGGALGLGGFRSMYNSLVRQGQASLQTFLTAVRMELGSTDGHGSLERGS